MYLSIYLLFITVYVPKRQFPQISVRCIIARMTAILIVIRCVGCERIGVRLQSYGTCMGRELASSVDYETGDVAYMDG